MEEQLEYMEDFGFTAARIHVLELHKRFSDAALVALQEQDILEAVRLLLLTGETHHKLEAVKHIVHGLWTLLPYGTIATASNQAYIASLLNKIAKIKPGFVDEDARRQVGIFQRFTSKLNNGSSRLTYFKHSMTRT